ncbi:hypothetical protein [Streptomyces sp. MNP-20]|uniref:hypothetical protein n=1 Tax=Streptomyces sp. MNP-20 TaxID=2721165 RepID=UPI001C1E180F|nr:hypothetical protein [Streptomyces sp. MNP-20]
MCSSSGLPWVIRAVATTSAKDLALGRPDDVVAQAQGGELAALELLEGAPVQGQGLTQGDHGGVGEGVQRPQPGAQQDRRGRLQREQGHAVHGGRRGDPGVVEVGDLSDAAADPRQAFGVLHPPGGAVGVFCLGEGDHLVATQAGDHRVRAVLGDLCGHHGEGVVQGLFVRADRLAAHPRARGVERELDGRVDDVVAGAERHGGPQLLAPSHLLGPPRPADEQGRSCQLAGMALGGPHGSGAGVEAAGEVEDRATGVERPYVQGVVEGLDEGAEHVRSGRQLARAGVQGGGRVAQVEVAAKVGSGALGEPVHVLEQGVVAVTGAVQQQPRGLTDVDPAGVRAQVRHVPRAVQARPVVGEVERRRAARARRHARRLIADGLHGHVVHRPADQCRARLIVRGRGDAPHGRVADGAVRDALAHHDQAAPSVVNGQVLDHRVLERGDLTRVVGGGIPAPGPLPCAVPVGRDAEREHARPLRPRASRPGPCPRAEASDGRRVVGVRGVGAALLLLVLVRLRRGLDPPDCLRHEQPLERQAPARRRRFEIPKGHDRVLPYGGARLELCR